MDLKTYGNHLALLATKIKQQGSLEDICESAAYLSGQTLLRLQKHLLDSSTQIPVDFVDAVGETKLALATIWPRNHALEDALQRSLDLLDEISAYRPNGRLADNLERPQSIQEQAAAQFEASILECVEVIKAGVAQIESGLCVVEDGLSAGFPPAQFSYPMTKAEIAQARVGNNSARSRQAEQFMTTHECRPVKGTKRKFEIRLDTMDADMRRRFLPFDPFATG